MNKRSILASILSVGLLLMQGCSSVRYTSTLLPSEDKKARIGNARVNIVSVDYKPSDPKISTEPQKMDRNILMALGMERYPLLFSPDRLAIPVSVRIDNDSVDNSILLLPLLFASLLTVPTIFPAPMTCKTEFDIAVQVFDGELGMVHKDKAKFRRKNSEWLSAYTPLAFIAPGRSDIPKRNYVMDSNQVKKDSDDFSRACCLQAIVNCLLSSDAETMENGYNKMQSRVNEIEIDGQPGWAVLVPERSGGRLAGTHDTFHAEYFMANPKQGGNPFEKVVVAKKGTIWKSTPHYLTKTETLTIAYAEIANGVPVRACLKVCKNPPVEDFLQFYRNNSIEMVRWRTKQLITAKNRTLPGVLKTASRDNLLELASRIEKTILDLSNATQQEKYRAHMMVADGKGNPEKEHMASTAYMERIAVLKPMLAAIKKALAKH
ncbi:hypothetical protein ACFLS1_05400 [Verrucomicrobiota bacterium]